MGYKWSAAELARGGGGMNNAAIQTFGGHAMKGFIREMIQNSLDASCAGKCPKIEIRRHAIDKEKIPGFETQFRDVFKAIERRWGSDHEGFFSKANKLFRRQRIPVLEYSDFQCVGLSGADDEPEGSFYKCVGIDGATGKQNDEALGSFGIGKNAIFALSSLRTVIYSSRNPKDEVICQGVAKLADHKMGGVAYNSQVFFGNDDALMSSIRRHGDVPGCFRRGNSEPGLSQFALGVELDDGWMEDALDEVMTSFYPALYKGKLSVEIIDDSHGAESRNLKVNQETLAALAKKRFVAAKEALKPEHVYLKRYALDKAEVVHKDIDDWRGTPLRNAFSLYLITKKVDGVGGGNQVHYTRGGMHIYSKRVDGRSVRNLGLTNCIAVFVPSDREVRDMLKLMEPPRHDAWEPNRLKAKGLEEQKLVWGNKLLGKIQEFVREEFKKVVSSDPSPEGPFKLKGLSKTLGVGSGVRSGSGPRIESDQESARTGGKDFEASLTLGGDDVKPLAVVFGPPPDVPPTEPLSGDDSPDRGGAETEKPPRGRPPSTQGAGKLMADATFILKGKGEEGLKSYRLILEVARDGEPANGAFSFEIALSGERGESVPFQAEFFKQEGRIVDRVGDYGCVHSGIEVRNGIAEIEFGVWTVGGAAFVVNPMEN